MQGKKSLIFIAILAVVLTGCQHGGETTTYVGQLPQKFDAITAMELSYKSAGSINDYSESYIVDFKQPINHKDPSSDSFLQKSFVMFRGFDCPTVLYTCGYDLTDDYISKPNCRIDIADNLNANLVLVEHRYFGKSVIADESYDYLTIRQQSDDLHNIFTVLKPIFSGKWISTGTSKDGETSVFYRYFYPDDMDVTTAFCSPFLTSLTDTRVGDYLVTQSGSDEERRIMDTVIRRYLTNGENGIYKNVKALIPYLSYNHYIFKILGMWFDQFSYEDRESRQEFINNVNNADNTKLTEIFLKEYSKNAPNMTAATEPAVSKDYYLIQTAKELGQYIYNYDVYSDLLSGTSFFEREFTDNPSFLSEEDIWLYDTYDNSVIIDMLDNFLPTTDKPILIVYSKDDPWTAAKPTKVSDSVKIIVNPDGVHNQDVNNDKHYGSELKKQIMDFITEKAGLPSWAETNSCGRGYSVGDKDFIRRDEFMIQR